MPAVRIDMYSFDQHIREGIEYLQTFWDLIPKYVRMAQLEHEFDLAILINEKNEFHRRVKENDQPGRRHMLPFHWQTQPVGYSTNEAPMKVQVPYRIGTRAYEAKMADYARRIDTLRKRKGG